MEDLLVVKNLVQEFKSHSGFLDSIKLKDGRLIREKKAVPVSYTHLDVYKRQEIDGATFWQKITKITLPLLKPTIIMLTLMAVGRIFYSDFGLFYQVPQNSGALFPVTNTIDTVSYTHLDVYKRQAPESAWAGKRALGYIRSSAD